MAFFSRWQAGLVLWILVIIFVNSEGRFALGAELSDDEQIMLSIREDIYNSNEENRAILDDKYWNDTSPCAWTGVECSVDSISIVSVFVSFGLQGLLPAGFGSLGNLLRLSLRGNRFTGSIPTEIFNSSSNLEFVDFGLNSLVGPIPISVGNLQKLSVLNLEDNQLNGTLLPLAGLKTFDTITSIYLQRNEIGGDLIPLEGMTSLVILKVGSNILTGDLSALRNLTKLQILDLKNNQLSDGLSTIGDLQITPSQGQPQLAFLDLESNRLNGDVPGEFFRSASTLLSLTLSNNRLTGMLKQPEVPWKMEVLCVDRNQLDGSIPQEVLNIPTLVTLNLSNNTFSGNISGFQNRSTLRTLDLSYNMLTAEIPETIFQMDPVPLTVNLTNNNFTGALPAASNDLMLGDTDVYLLNDNPYLCSPTGKYNLATCAGFSPSPAPSAEGSDDESSKLRTVAISVGVVGSVLVFTSLLVAVWSVYRYRKRLPRVPDHDDQQHPSFPLIVAIQDGGRGIRARTMKELREATDNFSPANQIGHGGFGTVYRGILDGQVVAIKKNETIQSDESKKQILNEISILSQVHHRNLVSLLGCCLTTNVAILILEYVPQGTLKDHLRGTKVGTVRLTWNQRLRIALQTAEALNYLHTAAYPPIFHQDVKSSNILLDEDLNAKVADFGISKLVPKDVTHITSHDVQGTLPYLDPDVHVSHRLTAKSDVYSFGVVILELLTAKSAIEFATHGPELSRWAALLSDVNSMNLVLDSVLQEEQESNMNDDFTATTLGLAQLAFRCLHLSPADRPSMREVVRVLTILNGVTVSSSVRSGHDEVSSESVARLRNEVLTGEYLRSLEQRAQYSPGDSRTSSASVNATFTSDSSRKRDHDTVLESSATVSARSSRQAPRSISNSHSHASIELQHISGEIQEGDTVEENIMPRSIGLTSGPSHPKTAP